jgi:Rrf2 family nitric oxide-sensitive transcriptional repressor
LGREPADINIGKVVRQTETDFFMAVCFDGDNNSCPYTAACTLKNVLGAATDAYLKVLDGVTLENLIKKPAGRSSNGVVSKPVRFQAVAKARRQ